MRANHRKRREVTASTRPWPTMTIRRRSAAFAESAVAARRVVMALTLLALVGIAPLLGACHTAAGLGEDLSAGGHAVTNSAEKHAP
jgi:entericidin B